MASPFVDYPSILRHLETRLLVADLKDILKELHLSTSGNKRPLIDRVASHLGLLKSANDVARYTTLKNRILRCGSPSMPIPVTRGGPPRSSIPAPAASDYRPTTNGMPYGQFAGSNWRPHGQFPQQQSTLNFKPSPFYEVVERLSNTATLPFSSRNTVSVSFVCSMNALDLLHQGTLRYKVAVMCADSTYAYNPNRQLLLEFPNPAEVLVNTRRLHANLKGMKNRPGTVPPADITSFIDRTPRLANRIDITYSCGTDVNKKYGVQIVLLKTHSVDELVERIKLGNRFTKESVLAKLRKPDDDDIELASFDLTLKDPLSYMRITVPCRSTFCKHNQCWDAMAFLSINEQTPQWTCPICHVAINGLSSIAVDGYFQDILEKVGPDIETILVDPQGNWKVPGNDNETEDAKSKKHENDDAEHEVLDLQDTEDEDDALKSTLVKPPHMKQEIDSRSTTPVVAARPTKRKASPVCIDLTEDSEDEIEPPKRVKHSDSMVLPPALAITPPAHRVPLPDLPSSAHALPSSLHGERSQSRISEPTNGFRHPSTGQEGLPPWRIPEFSQSSSFGTTNPGLGLPGEAATDVNTGSMQDDNNNNGNRITSQGREAGSFDRLVQQQITGYSDPSRTLDYTFDDINATESRADTNHSTNGKVAETHSLANDPMTGTRTSVLDSTPLTQSGPQDRPEDYSPPIIVPGSGRAVNLPQPQALFSDDFSDGDQDFY